MKGREAVVGLCGGDTATGVRRGGGGEFLVGPTAIDKGLMPGQPPIGRARPQRRSVSSEQAAGQDGRPNENTED